MNKPTRYHLPALRLAPRENKTLCNTTAKNFLLTPDKALVTCVACRKQLDRMAYRAAGGSRAPSMAYYWGSGDSIGGGFDTAKQCYACLWDEFNGKRPGCAWANNPWVWRISFLKEAVENAELSTATSRKPHPYDGGV